MRPAAATTTRARPLGARPLGARPLVVVLRALGLGDFLTGVPALRALADAHPGHRKVLAAPRALAPLVALAGGVDTLCHTPDLVPLDPSLRRPALAVDLHGRGPASHDLLVDLEPQRLVAFAHPGTPASLGGPRWEAEEHEVARWCRLLSESGIPADPCRLDLPLPPRPAPASLGGATLVHPGAGFAARRWPAERFAAVARAEAAAGRTVVVTGGPGEEALAATVARLAGAGAGAAGAGAGARARAKPTGGARVAVVTGMPLDALAALVGSAARVVCGDTGVAHLATALRTPSVVLFGPVPPTLWGPPPDRPWHVALWAGRRGDPHGREVDPGLLEVSVADVLDALGRLPAPPGGRWLPPTTAATAGGATRANRGGWGRLWRSLDTPHPARTTRPWSTSPRRWPPRATRSRPWSRG